jgi:shikimate kinase
LIFPTRISLVGFMGSGKSTIGGLLATRIGHRFVDSDEEIEARARARVSDIFSRQGEAVFRELERQVIADLLEEERCVIATGGGAFAQPACAQALLARSFTIHLECAFDEAVRRATLLGGRPLLDQEGNKTAALYAERKDKYSRAHLTIETTLRSPDDVLGDILRSLPRP